MRSLLGRFHRPMSRGLVNNMLTMNNLGDGSTLSLDFTTGVLDPRLTFSRAGGGTYVASDGYIYGVDSATSASLAIGTGSKSVTLTATAGVDRRFQVGQTVYFSSGANNMSGLVTAYNASTQVITINATATTGSGSFTSWFVGNASPRFDYSPTNIGEPRGLLVEGSSINYVTNSSLFSGYNNASMAAVTAGSEPNPEGTANSARQIYATAGGTYHSLYLSVTAGTNTQITVSIWAKARNYTHLFFGDLVSGRSAVRFNLSTGATDNNLGVGFVSAKTTAFPNQWWRCEMVVNVTASTSYGWSFVGVPSDATLGVYGAQYAGTGNAADGIYCYGFSVEAGSGASSYIPTGASGVTRNADQCELTSGVPALYDSATGTGTFLIDISHSNLQNANGGIELGAGTGNQGVTNRVSCRQDATFVGGTTLNLTPTGSGQRFKTVTAFAPSDLAASRNGNSAVTSSTNVTLTGMTALKFYIDAWAGGSLPAYGAVRQVKIWPTRLPNATIQTLSAL